MHAKKALLNAVVNTMGQILVLLLNFISRKVFLYCLNMSYLGVSQLFSSIVTMLSVAELGIGTAISFSLYQSLATEDKKTICALMSVYKKIYRIIGMVILVLGTAITPLVIKTVHVDSEIPYLTVIYFLYVVNTAISYFYSYSRTLIVADQQEYKLAKIDYGSKILLAVIQIILLFWTKSIFLYLAAQIVATYMQNLLIYGKVNKQYPYLRKDKPEKLPEHLKRQLKKNTFSMMIYKLAVVIVSGTDNIVISAFLGTIHVGLYANYSMIITSVQGVLSKLVTSVTATVGNIVAEGDKEYSYKVFKVIQYICFIFYGFCSVILMVLLSPFVELFFGKEYLINVSTIVVVLLNFYLLGMQGATSIYRDAQGIFWQGKLRPLAQGILNLVISVILVYYMKNLTAVFLGTVISRLLTITWFDPYAVHKYGFGDTSKLGKFYLTLCFYLLDEIVICYGVYKLVSYVEIQTYGSFIMVAIIASFVTIAAMLFSTMWTKEFKMVMSVIKRLKKGSVR